MRLASRLRDESEEPQVRGFGPVWRLWARSQLSAAALAALPQCGEMRL